MIRLLIGGVLGWGASVLRSRKQEEPDKEFEAEVALRLMHIGLLERRCDALATLHNAKQHALYSQTLDDVLDDDWLSKPRKGLTL